MTAVNNTIVRSNINEGDAKTLISWGLIEEDTDPNRYKVHTDKIAFFRDTGYLKSFPYEASILLPEKTDSKKINFALKIISRSSGTRVDDLNYSKIYISSDSDKTLKYILSKELLKEHLLFTLKNRYNLHETKTVSYSADKLNENLPYKINLPQDKANLKELFPDIEMCYFASPAGASTNKRTMIGISILAILVLGLAYYYFRPTKAPALTDQVKA